MLKFWIVAAFTLSVATLAKERTNYGIANNFKRHSITLNFNDPISPAALAQSFEDDVRSYFVKDQLSHVLGDVIFGDRIVRGDSSYTFRTVHTEATEDSKKVLKVRTIHSGVGNLLEEYAETEPNSGTYEVLIRIPIALDLTGQDMPEQLYPLYDPLTASTNITVDKKYRNTHRIGTVTFGNKVVDDQPCIYRVVSILERLDGKHVVSVNTSLNDESVAVVAFIESISGMFNFVPYDPIEVTEDAYISSKEEDFDFDLDVGFGFSPTDL